MASPAEAIFAPIRAAAGRTGLTDFLRWWWDELGAMVPPAWRERLSTRGIAYVAVEGDEWRALRLASGSLAEVGRANLGSLDIAGRRVAFRRLVEEASGGAGNVWLVLPAASVLVRAVALPLAAEEALRDAVGFELDRLTPFAQEVAMFDCRVTGRDAAAQRLSLELAATPRAPVEARLAELHELGATILGIGLAADLAIAPSPFNLLAPEARERPATSRATVAARVLAALAAALALVALVYPLWQKREAVIVLQPRLDKAKASADVADRLAQEIEKLAAEHNFLLARKQGQYPAVVLLEDLSRLLPDATWVQQLDIKSGPKMRELQISGETGSSSQLIEVLEKSGSLANASFKSPLTKGVTPNTERFLLAAEVKPRPLPEPMPEAALIAPAGAAAPASAEPAAALSGSTPTAAPTAAPVAAPAAATPPKPAAGPAATSSGPIPATATPPSAPAAAPAGAPSAPAPPKPVATPAAHAPAPAKPATKE